MQTIAFYYPGMVWRDADWLKNLLLFFDGVALLVPAHLSDRVEEADPALVSGLLDQGLLHILAPETLIDEATAQELVAKIGDLLSAGVFDDIVDTAGSMASHLSLSRLGQSAAPHLADMLVKDLENRGLARPAKDGKSISLHWIVRLVVLALLANILRPQGRKLGLDLSPATDRTNLHAALGNILDLPSLPTTGQVVTLDLQTVGVDVSAVALEDLLEFRSEHGAEFRSYARDIRQFVLDLTLASAEERPVLLNDRREWLTDTSEALAQRARSRWRTPLSLALGLTGAAWTLKTGDPMTAGLGAAAAVLAGLPSPAGTVDAYSYLLQAKAL